MAESTYLIISCNVRNSLLNAPPVNHCKLIWSQWPTWTELSSDLKNETSVPGISLSRRWVRVTLTVAPTIRITLSFLCLQQHCSLSLIHCLADDHSETLLEISHFCSGGGWESNTLKSDDINILVTEEVVIALCVCSELTQSGKENFGQQQWNWQRRVVNSDQSLRQTES